MKPSPSPSHLDEVKNLIDLERVDRISWIQASELANVSQQRVRLAVRDAVELEHRQASERRRGLERRPVGVRDAMIVELDAADEERQADRFTSTSEVEERELGGGGHRCKEERRA